MVQGGYMSPSSAKTLTVSKKSNVLDKIPPRGPKGNALSNSNTTNNNNNNNSTILSTNTCSIDVSKSQTENFAFPILAYLMVIFILFLKESQFTELKDEMKKQTEEMKKQTEEMRKLKAIIVKHENRIRSLEAAQKAREDDVLDGILHNNENSSTKDQSTTEFKRDSSASNLAPDEV